MRERPSNNSSRLLLETLLNTSLFALGAYGRVYLVTHKTVGAKRAMKTIKKSSIQQDEADKLFAEVNILKGIDHPHIVRLYELFQDEKHFYLITE